jgi:hypothetical protein
MNKELLAFNCNAVEAATSIRALCFEWPEGTEHPFNIEVGYFYIRFSKAARYLNP